jgi:uroporphyrin-III C-methyltransferase
MDDMKEAPAHIAPPQPRNRWLAAATSPVVVVSAIAVALLILQWYASQTEISNLQQELTQRIADSDAYNRESRQLARQAQGVIKEVEVKLGLLETRLAESQSQQVALEALYQELSRNRDEWALAEIEQMLTIASQQLQFAGNVPAALTALTAADSRLSRADRAQFIPIRKLIAKDIEHLKSLPFVDVTGMALKIDNLIATVDTLPLTSDERPPVAPPLPPRAQQGKAPPRVDPTPAPGFWAKLGTDVWAEVNQMVRISRVDQPDPALLTPGQSFFLRENLKLRLLNARFGLLQRDETNFHEDLQQAQQWIARYFDTRAKPVQNVQTTLKGLAATSLNVELPDLSASLNAVRNYKLAHERGNSSASR